MRALERYYFYTCRTFFVLLAVFTVSCGKKNEQPLNLQALNKEAVKQAVKEEIKKEETIPRVILLNPPAVLPVPANPVQEKAPIAGVEEVPPPKVIPVQTPKTQVEPVPSPPMIVTPVAPRPVNPPEKKELPVKKEFFSNHRPPQFVMFAFDNCTENERWQDLANFSSRMRELDKNIEFTFFLSGVNFIPNNKKMFYKGPNHPQGASNIGFGGSVEEVRLRSNFVHQLYLQGHELASHAVGHFSGLEWTQEDWLEELQNFKKIFLENFELFGFKDASKMASSIVGFRAPYLDRSAGLYPALKSLGYRYDTSDSADPRLWPKKNIYGLWQFPLFELTIVGNGSKSISMDYNFFVNQSKDKRNPKNDPENEDKYADEMMQTYLKYFKANYFGNRAPLSIGHHFFPYQRGVYNRVLKQFAMKICGLPEVKCVKYSTLASYLDSLPSGFKDDFQAARFERLPERPIP